jgi:hypothetical protein
MEFHEAWDLKRKYMTAYNAGSLSQQVGQSRSRAVVESVLEARPADRLAIGISADPKSVARLEIRVQRTDGPAFHEAKRIKTEVSNEARIVILERLEFPTYKSLIDGLRSALSVRAPDEPLRIGDPIRCRRAGPGTLGGFLNSRDGPAVLSSSHVLAAYSSTGEEPKKRDQIYRPPPTLRSLTGDHEVARLHHWSEFDKAQPNYADAAVAHILDGIRYEPNVIPPYDFVPKKLRGLKLSSMNAVSHGAVTMEFQKKENYQLLGKSVAKIGSASGYTSGHISAALVEGITAWVPWLGNTIYANIFEITPTDVNYFSEPGDSGSSVFFIDEQLVFGLHCAAADAFDENRNTLGYRVSYACSIQGILHEFDAYRWM